MKNLSPEGGQRDAFTWIHIPDAEALEKFYRATIENIRPEAKYFGYAIGVHGSLRRDLDLIAVPWTDEATGKDELARAVQEAACGLWQAKYEWEQKPCGRWAVSIPICWIDYDRRPSAGHIDLSVMERRTEERAPQWICAKDDLPEDDQLVVAIRADRGAEIVYGEVFNRNLDHVGTWAMTHWFRLPDGPSTP